MYEYMLEWMRHGGKKNKTNKASTIDCATDVIRFLEGPTTGRRISSFDESDGWTL